MKDENGEEVVRKHHVNHDILGVVMVEKPLPVCDGKTTCVHGWCLEFVEIQE